MKTNFYQNNYHPYQLPSSATAFPFTTNESSQWLLPNNTVVTRSNSETFQSIDENELNISSLRNNQTTELMLPVNSQDPYNHDLRQPF